MNFLAAVAAGAFRMTGAEEAARMTGAGEAARTTGSHQQAARRIHPLADRRIRQAAGHIPLAGHRQAAVGNRLRGCRTSEALIRLRAGVGGLAAPLALAPTSHRG